MIGPNILGSIFWLFAVAGATFSKASPPYADAGSALTLTDVIATIVAIGLVWQQTEFVLHLEPLLPCHPQSPRVRNIPQNRVFGNSQFLG
jgi:hypothetical protein